MNHHSAEAAVFTVFTVLDMTCNHCVGAIRAALNESMPDARVEIDLTGHRVNVTGDAARAACAITAAGYTPVCA